ncbi:MAG: hypothetical protein II843_03020, partial [Alphaproteobacteria bacterium]|nr:hypothetical protein [Alphaproteobacteria bacterium]
MEYVLKNLGFVCALGANHEDIVKNARIGDSHGMFTKKAIVDGKAVPFGYAPVPKKQELRMYDLIDSAINQIADDIELLKKTYAKNRVGIIIGSSNTGVHEAQKLIETAFQNNADLSNDVIQDLELGTPVEYICAKTG